MRAIISAIPMAWKRNLMGIGNEITERILAEDVVHVKKPVNFFFF